MQPLIAPLGDSAITITLAETVASETTKRARVLAAALRSSGIPHVEEVLPAYTAVTVFYDALHLSFDELRARVTAALDNVSTDSLAADSPRLHRIPVRYDGVDLAEVAASTSLTVEQVIEIHSSRAYDVDVLGFVPGFAYLSELDARLELPRRSQPRQRVPAGSVAIASRLTGIYPLETPGGWHILGRTDTVMFDPRRAEPSLFRPGDTVRFEPA